MRLFSFYVLILCILLLRIFQWSYFHSFIYLGLSLPTPFSWSLQLKQITKNFTETKGAFFYIHFFILPDGCLVKLNRATKNAPSKFSVPKLFKWFVFFCANELLFMSRRSSSAAKRDDRKLHESRDRSIIANGCCSGASHIQITISSAKQRSSRGN